MTERDRKSERGESPIGGVSHQRPESSRARTLGFVVVVVIALSTLVVASLALFEARRSAAQADQMMANDLLAEAERVLADEYGPAISSSEMFVQRPRRKQLTDKRRRVLVEARDLIDKARLLTPRNSNVERLDGVRLALDGEVDKAILRYRHALHIDPSNARAYMNLANALASQDQWEEAARSLRQAFESDEENELSAMLYLNSANILIDRGDLEEARSLLRIAIVIDEDSYEAVLNLAYIDQLQGDLAAALSGYERAISISPELIMAHHNRAEVLIDTGRYEEALEEYDTLLETHPDTVPSIAGRAQALEKLGRVTEAKEDYALARRLDPDIGNQIADYAAELVLAGQLADAIEEYARAVRVDPGNAEIWREMGLAYSKAGRKTEADECFNKARDLKADSCEEP